MTTRLGRTVAGLVAVLLLVALATGGWAADTTPANTATPAAQAPTIPSVDGFYQGQPILFLHTEASDQQAADLLTEMMGSPVIAVPSLARMPADALSNVFVFTNGVMVSGAMGPMGFQPDVFDSAPGDAGYSPLRALNLVTWSDRASPRLLTAAEEIQEAAAHGELTIEQSGVVINMPMLAWPGGHR